MPRKDVSVKEWLHTAVHSVPTAAAIRRNEDSLRESHQASSPGKSVEIAAECVAVEVRQGQHQIALGRTGRDLTAVEIKYVPFSP
jgi:hypothetical protein